MEAIDVAVTMDPAGPVVTPSKAPVGTAGMTPDPAPVQTPPSAGVSAQVTPSASAREPVDVEEGADAAPSSGGKPAKVLPPITDAATLAQLWRHIHGRPVCAMASLSKYVSLAMREDALTAKTAPSAKAIERTVKAHCTKGEFRDTVEGKPAVPVWLVSEAGWTAAGVPAPALQLLPEVPKPAPTPSESAPSPSPPSTESPAPAAAQSSTPGQSTTASVTIKASAVNLSTSSPAELVWPAYTADTDRIAALTASIDACASQMRVDADTGCTVGTEVAVQAVRAFGQWYTSCSTRNPDVDPLADAASPEVTHWSPVILLLAYGSSAPLQRAVTACANVLRTEMSIAEGSTGRMASLQAVIGDRLRLGMQRKAYGVRDAAASMYEDSSAAAIWRWECSDLDSKLASLCHDAPAAPPAETGAPAAPSVATPEPTELRPLSVRAVREVVKVARETMHKAALVGKRVHAAQTLVELLVNGPFGSRKRRAADDEAAIEALRSTWQHKVQLAQERLDDAIRKYNEEEEAAQKRALKRAEDAAAKEAAKAAEKAAREAEKEAKAKEKAAAKEAKLTAGSKKLTAFFGAPKVAPAATSSAVGPVATVTPAPAAAEACIQQPQTIERTNVPRMQVASIFGRAGVQLPRSRAAQRSQAYRRALDTRVADHAVEPLASIDISTCRTAFRQWQLQQRAERFVRIQERREERAVTQQRVLDELRSNALARTFSAEAAGNASTSINLCEDVGAYVDPKLEQLPAFVCARRGLIRGVTRMKLLSFHTDTRPAYFGTWSAARCRIRRSRGGSAQAQDMEVERYVESAAVDAEGAASPDVYVNAAGRPRLTPRRPFGVDSGLFVYEEDSEAEWDEEPEDDVTDLEAASAGEPDDDDDSVAAKDDGRADAAQYNYEDDWLAHDDEIEYAENGSGNAEKGRGHEEVIDLDAPAGAMAAEAHGNVPSRRAAPPPADGFTTATLLHDAGACFFVSFFDGDSPHAVGERDAVLAAQVQAANVAARSGHSDDQEKIRLAKLRAWTAEMTAMGLHGLTPSPLVLQPPPAGAPLDVPSTPDDKGIPGAATEAGPRGTAKRPVPHELIPLLARIVHGSALAGEKLRTRWREEAPAVLAKQMLGDPDINGDAAAAHAKATLAVANVSHRQLELLFSELAVRGRPRIGRSPETGAPAAVETHSTDSPADGSVPPAITAGAAVTPAAPARVELVDPEVYAVAALFNEGVDVPAAALRRVRWIVRQDVAASMHAWPAFDTSIAHAASVIVSYATQHSLNALPALAQTAAPPPAPSTGKRRAVADSGATPAGAPVADGALAPTQGDRKKARPDAPAAAPSDGLRRFFVAPSATTTL